MKTFPNVVHALNLDLRILQDQLRQAATEGRDDDVARLADKVLEFDEAVRALQFGVWSIPGPQAAAAARLCNSEGAR